MKRIFILISIASIIISLFAFTAFGASVSTEDIPNGYHPIDYNDYITNLAVDGDNDIVTVSFPDSLYSTSQTDMNGTIFRSGIGNGLLYLIANDNSTICNASVNCPSGGVGKNYLDLSNIPNGSVFTTTNKVRLNSLENISGTEFRLKYRSRIAYYDENFTFIKNQNSPLSEVYYEAGVWDYELVYEVAMQKPDNARYCFTYFFFEVYSFYSDFDVICNVSYEFSKPKLNMAISSLYRLQEQTGKTNQILGNIEDTLNGDAKPVAPDNSESVGDLSDLEDSLTSDTEQGREEAEIVFNESSDIILSHIQGFFFLGMVVEWFMGLGWLRGVLTVSLSLGIFAFIVNIVANHGKSIEHRSSSSKGKGG